MGIESLVFAVLASNALTIGLAGSALAISVITSAVTIGLSVGLSLLSASLFRPKQPKPEDVQTSVKNPTAPRTRHYGRVKTSGPWAFGDSNQGRLHRVIALGTGELDAIEEVWADDNLCTIDVNGSVTSEPYDGILRILTRIGTPSQASYSQLTAIFPEWTTAHVGNGVASLYATQFAMGIEGYSRVFPNGINTSYRVVARGSKVFNPSTSLTEWSDNAAAIIRDYMTHSDGMRLPSSMFTTTQANAGWLTAYNRCAELINKKAGGTEARWRLWGSYNFDERPADVLGRMLTCSDARIVPTPDGGVTLDIGTWAEPTVTIDADAIVGFSELARGHDILTTANVISATYLAPTHDFQATDADRWVDDADVSVRGEIVSDLAFNMAPSHGQARRLMKLAAYRANPSWVGSFQCNLRGLAAFGERFIRITYPLFGIDEVFELVDFRFDLGEGGILSTVTLQVQSMPEAAYDWDAATEEGDEPVSEDTVVDDTIPVPENFSFAVDRITIGGQQIPFGVLSFDAPPSAALTVEGRYKLVSSTAWNVVAVDPDSTEAQTPALSDGSEYEAQIRHVTQTGRVGDWTDSELLTPTADPTAPGILTGVGATGGVGVVDLSWTSPNSPNFTAVNIRRNIVNTEGTAALVHTEYGPASNSDDWQDTALAAGTYYYWLKARNGSGVESASVATGAVVVT
ncbi:fibronectin type III domain-containing protein [Mesorhizobium sp.]|uniref:fibronectin type III domain-containing protein n=1 Tax=Mesorhizobium sp. TaxID=1871066 RepID=UPI000FE4C3BE|nr:fibronectin type III domain-containing protein [Mesorhizobium sp.]RWO08238.1 MAG: fibronectin type III domain-containing protein [Mesorhizobium sp.]